MPYFSSGLYLRKKIQKTNLLIFVKEPSENVNANCISRFSKRTLRSVGTWSGWDTAACVFTWQFIEAA